jgi:hypothetical protein
MKTLTGHLELFAYLNRENIEYLLVGGVVAIAYGVPRTTQDIDILINPTLENAERLLKTLKKLKFGTAEMISPEELLKNEAVLFKDYFRIDVLTRLKNFEFKDVYPKRNTLQVGRNLFIPILSLEDLWKEKKSTKRDKDKQDISVLGKLVRKKKR